VSFFVGRFKAKPACLHPGGLQMKVGFIGLGNVGSKLAGSILRNGIKLTVHDLDRAVAQKFLDRGALWANSPSEMAADCDLVVTCLPSPAACSEVMEGEGGLLEGLGPGKIWAEMSTTDGAEVARMASLVEDKGAAAIECPVSGGCHRADTGNISILAGCSREVFERMLPILTILGRRILHTGPIGSASQLKVMTNYLATANLVTLCEALATAAAAGIDLETTYEAIRISSGNSFVHETESQVILNGSRDINFTMDLVAKDIGLFQALAERFDVPLEVSPLLIRIFKDGIERYGARAQSDDIIRRLEEAIGLNVRAPGFPSEMLDEEPEEPGFEVVLRRG